MVNFVVKLQMVIGAERLAHQKLRNEERDAHHFLPDPRKAPKPSGDLSS